MKRKWICYKIPERNLFEMLSKLEVKFLKNQLQHKSFCLKTFNSFPKRSEQPFLGTHESPCPLKVTLHNCFI